MLTIYLLSCLFIFRKSHELKYMSILGIVTLLTIDNSSVAMIEISKRKILM